MTIPGLRFILDGMKTYCQQPKLFALVLALMVITGAASEAEIVLPVKSEGTVPLARVDEFVVYHRQREELLVQASILPDADMPAFELLAFVIPVPAEPDLAELCDTNVLADLRAMEDPGRSIDALPTISGNYEVRKVGCEKGALNNWLTLNGLNTIDAGKLKYYEDNGWSFVVQRVMSGDLGRPGALKPVRISFACTYITYPLRFMLKDHPLEASLFLITKDNLNVSGLEDFGFSLGFGGDRPGRTRVKLLPQSVDLFLSSCCSRFTGFKELRRGNVHLYSAGASLNTSEDDRVNWSDEIQISGPHMSTAGLIQIFLAVAAAVTAVLVISRPRKRTAK